jgi:two-component system response regulator PfeR
MSADVTGPSPIILVGDPDIRALLADLLGEEGYTIRSVISPDAALALARRGPTGLIVIDLDVPNLDGVAFCRTFRRHAGEAPIILITDAGVSNQDVVRYGADASIARPFDLEMVVATVARLVRKR